MSLLFALVNLDVVKAAFYHLSLKDSRRLFWLIKSWESFREGRQTAVLIYLLLITSILRVPSIF
ncbi:hypothetical protein HanIR_Chr04g0196331 [Helianthus annuus]|nr:hypothetical protein HanIR_Chr04g0196331 [Helianthus annuus]